MLELSFYEELDIPIIELVWPLSHSSAADMGFSQ